MKGTSYGSIIRRSRLEFNLEMLAFMVKAGSPDFFSKLVKLTAPLLEIEADFEDLTRDQVTSPAYLAWVLDVMTLPARDQQAVRTYCEAEKQVWWATDGEDAFGATYALSEEEEKEAQEKVQEKKIVSAKTAKPAEANRQPTPVAVETPKIPKRKLSFKEQKEYETLEKEIAELERQKAQIIVKMTAGSSSHAELSAWAKENQTIERQLETKSGRWLELGEFA